MGRRPRSRRKPRARANGAANAGDAWEASPIRRGGAQSVLDRPEYRGVISAIIDDRKRRIADGKEVMMNVARFAQLMRHYCKQAGLPPPPSNGTSYSRWLERRPEFREPLGL